MYFCKYQWLHITLLQLLSISVHTTSRDVLIMVVQEVLGPGTFTFMTLNQRAAVLIQLVQLLI